MARSTNTGSHVVLVLTEREALALGAVAGFGLYVYDSERDDGNEVGVEPSTLASARRALTALYAAHPGQIALDAGALSR